MAYDAGLAQILREDLLRGVVEKKMMGGLCLLLADHMICGVHKGGAMFRVGKPNHGAALQIAGVWPMAFTGKPPFGFVDCADEVVADDLRRHQLLTMARDFVAGLPPK